MDALTYATLKVLVDGQAYLHALIHAGADAPEDQFKEAMDDFKGDTAQLISEELEALMALAQAAEEEE